MDLSSLFQAVTQSLAENQQDLDQADEFNRDHGSNMVRTFQTISSALDKKKGSSESAALSYAARQLSKKTTSGSGKIYAQNLAQAAGQFKGKKVDSAGALQLLQTLIGASQSGQSSQPASAQPAGGDLLGALLGGMAGGETSSPGTASGGGDLLSALLGGMAGGEASSPGTGSAGSDLLGSLLGGMAGGETSSQGTASAGGDLLGALLGGMAGGQSPSQGTASAGGDLLGTLLGGLSGGSGSGGGVLPALVQAFLGSSGMGNTTHRNQSTTLVIKAFLQALSSMSQQS